MNSLNTFINIFLEIIIVVIPLFLIVAYTTYSERKIIGFMQSRMGPMHVGPSGIFQPIADVIKLLTSSNEKNINEISNKLFEFNKKRKIIENIVINKIKLI